MPLTNDRRYGIVAGQGALLKDVIEACVQQNLSFFIMAFTGQTLPEEVQGYPHAWTSLGQIGQTLQRLRQEKVTHLVMAGRFRRPSFASLKLDALGARWVADLGLKALGDDGLLKGLMKKLEAEGFGIVAPETLLQKNSYIGTGNLGPVAMPEAYEQDGTLGFNVLTALSPFDFCQSVVVQERRLLGVEGPEGTNELLKRCAELADPDSNQRRPILIKGCKISQDLRADRPVVGPQTLKYLQTLGYAGLILQAESVLVVDKRNFFSQLENAALFCFGKKI